MSAIPLAALRPHPQDETDLRWRFQFADGEMGLKSMFPQQMQQLQLGGGRRGTHTPIQRDPDPRWVAAATRAREIDRALELVADEHRHVLRACYGVGQSPELHAYGDLAGLVLWAGTDRYQRARTRRTIVDWLARLAQRAKKDVAVARVHAEIVRTAEARLMAAARAYGGAKRDVRRRRHG